MVRRPKNDEELDIVVDIWLKSSLRAHDFVDRDYWLEKQQDMRGKYLTNSETWVCELNGNLVGFYSLVEDTVEALFVLPEFQARGIGSMLLEHAKSLRGKLKLSVFVQNLAAYSFYLHKGFIVLGKQLDENTGCQEFIMELTSS